MRKAIHFWNWKPFGNSVRKVVNSRLLNNARKEHEQRRHRTYSELLMCCTRHKSDRR